MNYMKRKFVYLLAVLLISAASCSFTNRSFDNPDKDKLLVDLITYVLEKGHYDPKQIDDAFSEEVFTHYIDALDPLRRYFLESDIKEFESYRTAIDDQIKTSDLSFFNLTYDRFLQRMDEVTVMYQKILEKPFNFNESEGVETDYENIPFAKSKDELYERWRKQLKLSALERYADALDTAMEEGSGKDPAQAEKEARESTMEMLDESFDFRNDLDRKDWFVVYLNSIVETFDPHTFYFAPEEKDRFDISMSGKFEGIGARLQKRNDNIKIVEIISGGPAWRNDAVEVGDEIIKVAQGEETPVSVVGMRLDDAVKLIKGPKGSIVNLTVKKIDGTIQVIPITRDVVEIEETYAKSSLVKKGDRTFGVINLPKFYIDFEDYSERNAATDVAKEIERLKEAGMEGLVLDLRNNGGGSLKTVVDMAGLFIKEGPVVQVKSTGQQKEVLEDTDKRIQWDGPLVILVNELSASASEILAAAMQDYKRAVVIGSKQTYGKGTVQNVIDLNQFLRGDNDYGDVGALKITTQKFYRINGGSTQLEGVKSDVVVPDRYSYRHIGEKDQDNPMPWDKISPVSFTPWEDYIDYETTIEQSIARMEKNPQISLIDENAKWVKEQQDNTFIPLSYEEYKKRLEEDQEALERFKAISEYKTDLSFTALPYEKQLMEQDSILRMKRERWFKDLQGDVYVEEALNVLSDLEVSNIKKGKLAQIKN